MSTTLMTVLLSLALIVTGLSTLLESYFTPRDNKSPNLVRRSRYLHLIGLTIIILSLLMLFIVMLTTINRVI